MEQKMQPIMFTTLTWPTVRTILQTQTNLQQNGKKNLHFSW